MAPDQEVRAAALNAAVLHHKVLDSSLPAPRDLVLDTAKEFEKYINGGEEV